MKTPANETAPLRGSGFRYLLALQCQRFEARLRRFTGNPFISMPAQEDQAIESRAPLEPVLPKKSLSR
jgi:hypothetical protein